MHNGWMWDDWSHMGPFMGLGMLLFWGLLIYAVILLVRGSRRNNQNSAAGQPRETPLDIVKRRYASGEIDKEEFDRIRKDLD